MKFQTMFRTGGTALMLFAVAGCYNYPKPPSATMGETYTQRNKDEADRLLDGITELTLSDAQQISITNNPTYIAAFHAVSAARMRYLQSWGAYSPVVTAGFSFTNSHTWTRKPINTDGTPSYREGIGTNSGVSVNWLVFDGLSREFSVLIASHGYDYQKRMEEDEARTLMRAVAYAYNTVLLAIENKRIAQEDRDFQESSLRDTRLKYQAGAVPLSDVLNFEIYMNTAESNLIAADYQYETAVYALAVLMGYPEGTLPDGLKFPSDFKTNFTDLLSVDVYLDTALANRPDLKAYREQLEVSRYQMYQTWSAYSPTVKASFDMGYGTTLTRQRGWNDSSRQIIYNNPHHTYSESPTLAFGLTADWTIFNGLIRYNKVREYQANLAVAEFTVAAQWLTVVNEVRAAYANYIQSVKQTRLYEKTRDLSARQRDLVDEGYKAGNTELTRLNEAQRDLVEAETNLAASYINIQNAKAQLDAAVALNPAEYYKNPLGVAPGEVKNTPVPEGEVGQPVTQETQPLQAPAQDSFIPPANPNPAPATDGAASPPAIPADPTQAPQQ